MCSLHTRLPQRLLGSELVLPALLLFVLSRPLLSRLVAGSARPGQNSHRGAVLADQVLFVVCTDFLLRQPASLSRKLAFAVLRLHVLSGSLYLTRSLLIPAMQSEF
jgi:hypothetical protein